MKAVTDHGEDCEPQVQQFTPINEVINYGDVEWRIPDIKPTIPTALTIVSVSLITYGGTKLESAYRALSKAIWWYNRDLKK